MSEARRATPTAGARSMPYVPGLDGLRAIAVVAVLLYHGQVAWFDGGFLGVEVFFVISGYLITALLLQEKRRDGAIDLKGFWIRRGRRLLPAVYVLLASVSALALLVATDVVDGLRREILGALFYVTNWQLIVADQSYFESFGRPSPLQHLWSLAVEEQFYLVWPLLMLIGLRHLSRRTLFWAIVAGVLASTAWMWALYEPFSDPSRIYYGTDTRAAGLLLGAALAFVWQPWNMRRVWVRVRGPMARITDGVGVLALVGIVWIFHTLTESSDRLYRGGFLVTAAVTCLLIAATVVPTGRLGVWLGATPLRWIGTRSYGIYLWHWPIFVFTRPRLDTTLDGAQLFTLRVLLTFAAAEMSYRFIEQPIRERRVTAGLRSLRGSVFVGDPAALRNVALRFGMVALVPLGIIALQSSELSDDVAVETAGAPTDALVIAAPSGETASDVDPLPAASGSEAVDPGMSTGESPVEVAGVTATADPVDDGSASATGGGEPLAGRPPAPAENAEAQTSDTSAAVTADRSTAQASAASGPLGVQAIGDSVMVSATDAITAQIPDVTVDALIGRQWWTVDSDLRVDPDRAHTVVVHLGSNGAPSPDMIDAFVEDVGPETRILLVTARAPVRWESDTNGALRGAAQRWPNVEVLDWQSTANEQWAWFEPDGVHLTPEGRSAYAGLIASAL